MWPWEHLAIGYLCYSLFLRITARERPRSADVVAVALGSQFPDLIDKPLGWGTTLLPSGTTLAHSLLVAVPVAIVVIIVAQLLGRFSVGFGFSVAYLVHLPGDVIYPVLVGGDPKLSFLLWPLVPVDPSPPGAVLGRANELVMEFVGILGTPAGYRFLAVEALLIGLTIVLWRADGLPGLELVGLRPTDQ